VRVVVTEEMARWRTARFLLWWTKAIARLAPKRMTVSRIHEYSVRRAISRVAILWQCRWSVQYQDGKLKELCI